MAQNAMHASDSEILRNLPVLKFVVGPYHYEITTNRGINTYKVSDGARSQTAMLTWAFGVGRAAQSYLFKKEDGAFYEARVTFFDTLKALDFTPARALSSPKDIDEAMYRPVGAAEVTRCFGCHTTASTIGDRFDEKNLIPGVTCEACHSPGAKHASSERAVQVAGIAPDSADTGRAIFNPARLNPTDSVDFCGACHGAWWDVKLSGVKDVSTARSQPYRLEGSKCWGKGDARLTCIACHDPHLPLQTEPSAYDAVCSGCHLPKAGGNNADQDKIGIHSLKTCSVSTKNCVSCHMEKVDVPEMHYKFTDHRIRIVRAGEAFPE